MKSLSASSLLAALSVLQTVLAIGSPIGFATGTTGGAAGATVTPTTLAEVVTYLSDSTARTIVLTKIFDFTTYYGSGSGTACKPWTCSSSTAQMLLNGSAGGCEGKTLYPVTFYNAGQNKALAVGSNKTILGKGNNAGIKGIGLAIKGVSNVIVQNIKITDINESLVWGGDAIDISSSSKVWIDHNYIARVGRQHIVVHYENNTGITISNNFFDGQSAYSVSCNGMHYWIFLFVGTNDQITLAYNRIYRTAGRGPHVGGMSGNKQLAHIVNNYYDTVGGHAIDAGVGSTVLTEGNYFKSVSQPDTGTAAGGVEYFVQTVAEAGACSASLGRVCEWNRFESSGTVATRVTSSVLTAMSSFTAVKNPKPKGVADVPAFVLANAGVGIIN